MNTKALPNFLIVGAARSGTTSLYHYLDQHPDIFFSESKEPCFLAYARGLYNGEIHKHAVTNLDNYVKLFTPGATSKWRGEASAIYLHLHEEVINNIQYYIPDYQDLRIIMILRNPIERAFSQYMRNVRNIKEDLSFEEAIEKEAERKLGGFNSDYFYVERGFYYKQVKAYLERFKYVKVALYDDFNKNSLQVIDSVLQFLQLKRNFEINTAINYDKSGHPKFESLIKLRRGLINNNNPIKSIAKTFLPKHMRKKMANRFTNLVYDITLEKKSISKGTYLKLLEVYRNDIEQLSKLINRDLSDWLEPKTKKWS
jgi:hypothetical protein